MTSKRIAIIGTGASGLPAIKSCLDEGLTPVCFEKAGDIGGLWRYTEEPVEGQACVMKSTVINTSKEMMSYSDFPIPEEYPVFLHNTLVYKYFKQYVQKFDLEKYIQFHEEVIYVKKAENFPIKGQWEITHRNLETDEEKTEIFDGVMVCSGHHADKYIPTFRGLKDFKGKVLHSHDYRRPDGFAGKRILVIGVGNSGGDVAVELSRTASQVFLSTRRGTWVNNRLSDYGYPVDMLYISRPVMYLLAIFPSAVNKFFRHKLNKRFDHDRFCLRPAHDPFQEHPMINDALPDRIASGAVRVKANVKRFTETGAEFADGTFEDNIDVVILATGYSIGFPFIDKEIIDVQDNKVQLYKFMFLPDLENHTLAMIGCFQPLGALNPISELQARLAARVFKGETVLPPREEMWADIMKKESVMAKRYSHSRRHTIQLDYVTYTDEIAKMIGCSISHAKLLIRDPVLALKVLFGPATPYQYRLFGPGKWSGARDAIMSQWTRVETPLQTRSMPVSRQKRSRNKYWIIFASLCILCFIIRYYHDVLRIQRLSNLSYVVPALWLDGLSRSLLNMKDTLQSIQMRLGYK